MGTSWEKAISCHHLYHLISSVAEAKRLQTAVFTTLKVGLLHGQMKSAEKDQVMMDFMEKRYDILVSTVVIEVGIDVPNATVMVVEHAGRFGLSQLHQLRGRIGRGSEQSYCLLFGNPKTQESQERLKIMTKTCDGFQIAETVLGDATFIFLKCNNRQTSAV
ncbi:MAG: recG 2 [Candidatus Brocadiaceae bacterium]|nr:recG 2 [Candidatus Brocadiaceae bacterium]